MKNEYYESIKDKHFWYFLQPHTFRNHYTYSKESRLFGLLKSESIISDPKNEDEQSPDLFDILNKGPVGEVEFYKGDDGHYYLDLMALFKKNDYEPMTYDSLKGIANAYNLLLPPPIAGRENLWVFNKFGSTFKDIEQYCRFVRTICEKTGNTVVLAVA